MMQDLLLELRAALARMEGEYKAMNEICWSASPLAGVSADDVPGVALEIRRMEVRRAMQAAETATKHMVNAANLASFKLERSAGGWYGHDSK